MSRTALFSVVGLVALAAGLGQVYRSRSRLAVVAATPSAGPVRLRPAALAAGYSNILPQDYVGPESCKDCHEAKYVSWQQHPHSRMNQLAQGDAVKGDFSGASITYDGGTVRFEREGETSLMTLERGGKRVRRYRITRTVGSRFMQFYIGVQTEGPEPKDAAIYREEQKLPFGYWFRLARWLPVSYFDPVGAETKPDGTPAYDPFDSPRVHFYAANCMLCHNTYPYLYRLALPDGLGGFPQGDVLLAAQQVLGELQRSIDLTPRSDSPASVKERIRPDHLTRLGVSCESCHFGAREHVKEQREILFVPTSPYVKLQPQDALKSAASDKKNPYAVMGICAQCHCATITTFPNGAGTWNSREALDMLGGACTSQIKCTDCHDPHRAGGPDESAPAATGGAEKCLGCHVQLRSAVAKSAHTRHGDSVTCLDCHMPKVTQGLEAVVRTHRIARPAEDKMLAAGSANACNLCHLDKPITWTLAELEKGWARKLVPDETWSAVYGAERAKPVGLAWLEGENPSMRLVASQAYARSPLGKAALPNLLDRLADPVAVNRVFATFAVERVRGRPLGRDEYDVLAPPARRAEQIEALRRSAPR